LARSANLSQAHTIIMEDLTFFEHRILDKINAQAVRKEKMESEIRESAEQLFSEPRYVDQFIAMVNEGHRQQDAYVDVLKQAARDTANEWLVGQERQQKDYMEIVSILMANFEHYFLQTKQVPSLDSYQASFELALNYVLHAHQIAEEAFTNVLEQINGADAQQLSIFKDEMLADKINRIKKMLAEKAPEDAINAYLQSMEEEFFPDLKMKMIEERFNAAIASAYQELKLKVPPDLIHYFVNQMAVIDHSDPHVIQKEKELTLNKNKLYTILSDKNVLSLVDGAGMRSLLQGLFAVDTKENLLAFSRNLLSASILNPPHARLKTFDSARTKQRVEQAAITKSSIEAFITATFPAELQLLQRRPSQR